MPSYTGVFLPGQDSQPVAIFRDDFTDQGLQFFGNIYGKAAIDGVGSTYGRAEPTGLQRFKVRPLTGFTPPVAT